MKDHMHSYKDKLEKSIGHYMEMPVSERSAAAVKGMTECWEEIDRLEKLAMMPTVLTMEDAEHWRAKMQNADGTMGGHWTPDQTTAVAESIGVRFDHISPWAWGAAMNMMYSDYGAVAEKFGVGTPEFFAELTKAFLFDQDGPGPEAKLAAYYHSIVCNGEY